MCWCLERNTIQVYIAVLVPGEEHHTGLYSVLVPGEEHHTGLYSVLVLGEEHHTGLYSCVGAWRGTPYRFI